MKKVIVAIFILALSTLTAQAQTLQWDIGFQVSEPLGLTLI